MTVPRNLSIQKRLERLEARQKQVETSGREAFVVLGTHEGERHLELSSSDGGRCWFQEKPGPRPQISDLGRFSAVMGVTQAEDNA